MCAEHDIRAPSSHPCQAERHPSTAKHQQAVLSNHPNLSRRKQGFRHGRRRALRATEGSAGGFDESCLSSEAHSAEGEFFRRPRVRGRRRKSGFSRIAGPPVSKAPPSTAALYKRSSQGHVVIKGRQNHSCRIRRINPSTTTSSASTV